MYYTPEITNSWTTLTLNPPIVQTFAFTGSATNPIHVETAFGASGRDATRVIRFRRARSEPADVVYAAMEPHGAEETCRRTSTSMWVMSDRRDGIDGNLRWQPADSDRHSGSGSGAHRFRGRCKGFDTINVTKSHRQLHLSLDADEGGKTFCPWIERAGCLHVVAQHQQRRYQQCRRGSVSGGDSGLHGSARQPIGLRIRHPSSVVHRCQFTMFRLFRDAIAAAGPDALGGWQLGTIITAQTGFAAALAGVVDTTGTGVRLAA